jgi:hypothetical protein
MKDKFSKIDYFVKEDFFLGRIIFSECYKYSGVKFINPVNQR